MKKLIYNEWIITIQETDKMYEAFLEHNEVGAKIYMFGMLKRDFEKKEDFEELAIENIEGFGRIYKEEFVTSDKISDLTRFSINVTRETKDLIEWALINSKMNDEQTAEFWKSNGKEELYKEYIVKAYETQEILNKLGEIGCMEWINSGTIEIKI